MLDFEKLRDKLLNERGNRIETNKIFLYMV